MQVNESSTALDLLEAFARSLAGKAAGTVDAYLRTVPGKWTESGHCGDRVVEYDLSDQGSGDPPHTGDGDPGRLPPASVTAGLGTHRADRRLPLGSTAGDESGATPTPPRQGRGTRYGSVALLVHDLG